MIFQKCSLRFRQYQFISPFFSDITSEITTYDIWVDILELKLFIMV